MRFFAKRNLVIPVLLGGATVLTLQTMAYLGEGHKETTAPTKAYVGIRDFCFGFTISFFTSLLSNYCCPSVEENNARVDGNNQPQHRAYGQVQEPYGSLPTLQPASPDRHYGSVI